MIQALMVVVLTLGSGWLGDAAFGQRGLVKNRAQTAIQQRREKRQAELLVEDGAKLLKAGKKVLAVEKL